jgi:hypothetical protein
VPAAPYQHLDGLVEVGGDADRAHEVVAGADRQDAEGDAAEVVAETVEHLVQGAVAAGRHHQLDAVGGRPPRQLLGVAGLLRLDQARLRQAGERRGERLQPFRPSRLRVRDDQRLQPSLLLRRRGEPPVGVLPVEVRPKAYQLM